MGRAVTFAVIFAALYAGHQVGDRWAQTQRQVLGQTLQRLPDADRTGDLRGPAARGLNDRRYPMGLFTRDPRRPVAVVDERTYRQAARTVSELLATGDGSDLVKAHFAITAILGWLRYEISTGRRSRRVNRARRLEQWEARCDEVRRALGLP